MTLTSDLFSRICIESGAYPIFFEVEIPNLVFGCILGWQSVVYHFGVIVTYDLLSKIIVSSAYLLYHLR